MVLASYVTIAFALAWYFNSQATTTVLFVRHAETIAGESLQEDPSLSAIGRFRAAELVRFLGSIDVYAGVDAIYASESKRAMETVEPLAKHLTVDTRPAKTYEVELFAKQLIEDHKGQIILLAIDANEISPLIAELHGHQSIPSIAADEYDNLYIVTVPWGGGAKVKTLRLRYGTGADAK